jgi:hypothetical protein
VVSFTPLPLYPQGKSPRFPSYRRLDELQSRSASCEEEKSFALPGTVPGEVANLIKKFHAFMVSENHDGVRQKQENLIYISRLTLCFCLQNDLFLSGFQTKFII